METSDTSGWLELVDGESWVLTGTSFFYTVMVEVKRGARRVVYTVKSDGGGKTPVKSFDRRTSVSFSRASIYTESEAIEEAKRRALLAYKSSIEYHVRQLLILYTKVQALEQGSEVGDGDFLTRLHEMLDRSIKAAENK